MSATLYDLLGVAPTADPQELRTAYRHRMLEVHPDKGGTTELCQRVMAAFERLTDPADRRKYDQYLERCRRQKFQVGPQNGNEPAVAHIGKGASKQKQDGQAKSTKCEASSQKNKSASDKKRKFQHSNSPDADGQSSRGSGIAEAPSGDHLSSTIASEAARGRPTRRSRQGNCLIARIVMLLGRVLRKHRRNFIETKLSEKQRKEIEAFVLAQHKDNFAEHRLRSSQYDMGSLSDSSSSADDSDAFCLQNFHRLTEPEQDLQGTRYLLSDDVEFSVLALEDSTSASALVVPSDFTDAGATEGLFSSKSPACMYEYINEAGDGPYQTATGVASHLRGISKEMYRGVVHYTAKIGFEWLHLRTKRRRNLSQAVDDHIILVAIKARATSHDAGINVQASDTAVEQGLRRAISEVLEEYEVDPIHFCMDIHVSVPAYHWVCRCLLSPYYSFRELDAALDAWQRFRKARGRHGVGGAGLLYRVSPAEAAQIWGRVCSVYIDVWSQRGGDAHDVQAKLAKLEALSEEHRCRQRESWERTQLEREERLQRAVERAQAIARARQRRAEQKERRLMYKEDQFMQHCKQEKKSLQLLKRLEALAELWTRQLRQEQLAAIRFARCEQIRCAREAQRSADLQRKQHLQRERALRAEHEARRRWMHRRDLTMEEILQGWKPSS